MHNPHNAHEHEQKTKAVAEHKASPLRKLGLWVNGEEFPVHERDYDYELPIEDTARRQPPFKQRLKTFRKAYVGISIAVCTFLVAILLITCSQLPPYGEVNVPTNNEVAQKYIEEGLQDTGAQSITAGLILDYRAFDTLGESTVLFIAVMAVVILLRRDPDNPDLEEEAINRREEMLARSQPNVILKIVASILIPFILLYGAYVVLNGHISPGGGFSGGAIMGAALILFASSYGFKKVGTFFNFKTFTGITSTALLVYACSKAYSFFTGANHLESYIPKGIPGAILSGGLILPLNICVGLVVACTMYGFYSLFSKGDI